MNEADRICRHCSTYACGKQDPADMCDGALREKLTEAEARAERYAAALREILGKASCTCSEDWHGRKDERCAGQIARAALAPPPADGGGGE